MRKPILAGNWKMHKTISEAKSFVEEIKGLVPPKDLVDTIICAPSLFLDSMVERADGSDLKVGAQNMHFEEQGAFTGETSPVALADLGVTYVIIGHSERRAMFAETDETVNQKVHAAFKYGLTPIVCVGETLEQREAGKTEEIVSEQIEKGLTDLSNEQASQVVVAYEPIWAIGTGKSATADDANLGCHQIREQLANQFGQDIAEKIRIQYGGSVKPENIETYMSQQDIDGALVGGASLQPQSFLQLLEVVKL